jgi:CDP-diglyceride synthetase
MDRTESTDIELNRVTQKDLLQPRNLLLLIAIAALSMVPGFLFSRLHVTDGFLYQVIAYIRMTLPVDRLEAFIQGGYSFRFVDYLPGYPMILSLLSRIAVISPEQLQFMPIAAVLVPVCYFALAHKLFRSITISCLLALYGAYDIGLASHYNVFAYTWTNLLYLAFVLLSLRLSERKRASDAIVLFILFGGTLFLHYTATLWTIVLIVVYNAFWLFQERHQSSSEGERTVRSSFAMPLAFVVAFLAFNRIFYRVWLPSFQRLVGATSDPVGLFAAKTGSYLGAGTATPEPYQFLNPWGESFGWWRVAQYGLILIPVALWFLKAGMDLLRRRPIQMKLPHYLELTVVMLVTAVVDWFVYGSHAGINMRYVALMFPFLTVISIDQLDAPKWLRNALTAGLVFVAFMTFAIGFRHYSDSPPTSYAQTQLGSKWFFERQPWGPVLTDLDTWGLFLVTGGDLDRDFPASYPYDSEFYATVVEPEQCLNADSYAFVIVDTSGIDKPLHGIHNRLYEPLSGHMDGIRANTCLNRIYDDGAITIFATTAGED